MSSTDASNSDMFQYGSLNMMLILCGGFFFYVDLHNCQELLLALLCPRLAPITWISMKFDMEDFYENMLRN